MEDEKKLYPMKFCTLQDDYSWGSEIFRLADLGYRDSLVKEGWLAGNSMGEVMDTYMDRVTGESVFEKLGRQFPVCVKIINVKGRMPLRVNPDDTTAQERYDFLGKEKLWYVLSAGKNASLMIGFKNGTDASTLYEGCLDNNIEKHLNIVAPHAGQVFHIAPGTVHAAQGEVSILEICESSPLDFCLCGWGEEVSPEEFDESLSLVDALDFIDYKAFRYDKPEADALLSLPQFEVRKLKLTTPLKVSAGAADGFVVYSCISGSASVQLEVLGRTADFKFAEGETLLVPAECSEFALVPLAAGTEVLETTVPFMKEKDAYINPGVPEKLDDEE